MKILIFFPLFFAFVMILSSCTSLRETSHRDFGRSADIEILEAKEDILKDTDLALQNDSLKKTISDSLFLKYQDASLNGDADLSVFILTRLKILYPKSLYLEKKYYLELLRLGKIDLAERGLTSLFAKDQSLELGIFLVTIKMNQVKTGEAQEILFSLMKKYPKAEEPILFLAQSFITEKKYLEAKKLLSSRLKIMPNVASLKYMLGQIEEEQGNKEAAIDHYKKTLKLDPKYTLAALSVGMLYEKDAKGEEAVHFYEEYLEHNQDDLRVLSRLVDLLLSHQDYKNAQKYLEALQGLAPDDLEIKLKLGILYINAEDYTNALSVFKELLQAAPESDKLVYYLGALYMQIGRGEEAYEEFIKVSKKSEYYSEAQLSLAQILYSESVNLKDEGKRFISFVHQTAKENEDIAFNIKLLLVSYYEERGAYISAIDELEDLQSEENYGVHHDYYLALLYERNEDYKEARKVIFSLLKKMPTHAHALNYLAYSYLERDKDFETAKKYLTQAIALSPDDGYIRDTLGYYYYLKGNYKMALEEFLKAQKATESDKAILNHLGLTYEALSDYSLAIDYYKKALLLCGSDEKDQEEKKKIALKIKDCQMKLKRFPADSPF